MANIDDFKANLIGGGARANQYRVTITPPPGIAIGLDVRRASFLVTAAQLPASTLGEIAVPFRGRNIYVAGDRPAPDPWSVTFYNDTDFMVRNAIERWMNGINNITDNEGLTDPNDYQVDGFVDHLDRDGNSIKQYQIRGCFPTSLDGIALSYGTNDAIEDFGVTLDYQYFETDTTT